jgi:DNA modification methylase
MSAKVTPTPPRRRPPTARRAVGARPPAHLYRLDARAVITALPARSISVLITDPPYRTVSRTAGSKFLRKWFARSLSWPEIERVLALVRPRMRPDGIALVMTNSDGLGPAIEALRRAGFSRVRPIVWDKQVPGLGGGLRHRTEQILVGYLPGSRTLAGVDLVSVPSVGPGTTGRYPTEKPADLGRALAAIARVGRGDVVIDPFCGSGALLTGARERGATVVGCDLAAAAIKRATSRLGGAKAGPSATIARPRGERPRRGVVGAQTGPQTPGKVAKTSRTGRPRASSLRRASP